MTRRSVEELSRHLASCGVSALPYHAGMPDPERTRNQDAFRRDEAHLGFVVHARLGVLHVDLHLGGHLLLGRRFLTTLVAREPGGLDGHQKGHHQQIEEALLHVPVSSPCAGPTRRG